ncbi:glutathione transferase GstA [Chitinivorax sp. B]|uniref:glutathione transferase GstA n=1 Tax=Chitinivorax sp. B TaxID=2502235 RepID=UPI0010F63EA0|nr:glutathione transferase GstA [Chitinivorax sp. B]
MKLFYSPGACSLVPHIMLHEAGLAFSLVRVDTAEHQTAQGADYYVVNPKGQVPLLELEDGQYLSEGPVIAQYIGDRAARHDLMPVAGSMARYRVMEWQNYITSELHKSFSPLFHSALDTTGKAVFTAALHKKFEWVSGQLQGKHYLTGDHFTAADAYLFVVAGWAKHVGLDLSPHLALGEFLKRVASRPAVQSAMRAEGLLN